MGRTLKFERPVVLQKAMDHFWRHGYKGSSVDDLTVAVGLRKGSLYRSYGNKKQIFLDALDFYNCTVVDSRRDRITHAPRKIEAIREFYSQLIARTILPKGLGCLNTNSYLECGPEDPEILEALSLSAKKWEVVFYRALRQAQKDGDLSKSKNIREIARFLVGLTQAINVVGKINRSPPYMRSILNVGLAILD